MNEDVINEILYNKILKKEVNAYTFGIYTDREMKYQGAQADIKCMARSILSALCDRGFDMENLSMNDIREEMFRFKFGTVKEIMIKEYYQVCRCYSRSLSNYMSSLNGFVEDLLSINGQVVCAIKENDYDIARSYLEDYEMDDEYELDDEELNVKYWLSNNDSDSDSDAEDYDEDEDY